MAALFSDLLFQGTDVRVAFSRAVNAHCPLNPASQVQILLAAPARSEAILLCFNGDGEQRIEEVPPKTAANLGRIAGRYKSVSTYVIGQVGNRFAGEPVRYLACALGVLQSWGLRENLIERYSAGGSFCGLLATPTRIEWQPDILYILYASGMLRRAKFVASIIRDHVLVVRSTVSESSRYFGDSLNGGLSEKWKNDWWDRAFNHISTGSFDYVIALDTQHPNVTVFELLGRPESAHARLKVSTSANGNVDLDFSSSSVATEAMKTPTPDRRDGTLPLKFSWFPFEIPTQA